MKDDYNPLILIIEDVPENIQVLLQILEKEAFRFAIATNAEDGFQAIEAEKPDLILLDVILPNTNGFEICEQLKADGNTMDIPVIFLTVLDEVEDVLKGFKLGAADYITKPFNELEVLARVSNQLKIVKAQRELEEINKTKDWFFSIIGHELKNPFNNIINFLEMVLKNIEVYDRAKIEELIRIVYWDSIRTSDLLDNLLLWSYSQNKTLEVNKEVFNLAALIENNISLLQKVAERKNITVENLATSGTKVIADRNMVSTVIRNLLANAIKFTKKGSIVVDMAEKDTEVLVSVKDTGVGMSDKAVDQIFQMDKNISTKGTNNESGSGLGLILCREFLERHGKNIWVETKPDHGSTFYFTLDKA
ncbi:MAG: response regulator [Bacteroidota bacterium]